MENPKVNVGTTGHIDHDSEDNGGDAPEKKLGAWQALKQAISEGIITSKQGKEMWGAMGISQSTFTRSAPNKKERKRKRKLQQAARRLHRKNNNR